MGSCPRESGPGWAVVLPLIGLSGMGRIRKSPDGSCPLSNHGTCFVITSHLDNRYFSLSVILFRMFYCIYYRRRYRMS